MCTMYFLSHSVFGDVQNRIEWLKYFFRQSSNVFFYWEVPHFLHQSVLVGKVSGLPVALMAFNHKVAYSVQWTKTKSCLSSLIHLSSLALGRYTIVFSKKWSLLLLSWCKSLPITLGPFAPSEKFGYNTFLCRSCTLMLWATR